MNQYVKTLTNGFIKENPTFVLLLGMCPTLATTTSGKNGLMMGLATTFVLEFGYLASEEVDPRCCAYPCIYRGDCRFRNGVAASHPGFPPRSKQ